MKLLNEGVSTYNALYEAFLWWLSVVGDWDGGGKNVPCSDASTLAAGAACSYRDPRLPHCDVHSDCSTSWNIRRKTEQNLTDVDTKHPE